MILGNDVAHTLSAQVTAVADSQLRTYLKTVSSAPAARAGSRSGSQRMNNLLMLRTRVNSGQHSRGRGLI